MAYFSGSFRFFLVPSSSILMSTWQIDVVAVTAAATTAGRRGGGMGIACIHSLVYCSLRIFMQRNVLIRDAKHDFKIRTMEQPCSPQPWRCAELRLLKDGVMTGFDVSREAEPCNRG